MPKTELYVGNLNRDVTRKDIENVFDKYGRLLRCDLKNRGMGSIYAFLEFDKYEDAEVNIYCLLFCFIFNHPKPCAIIIFCIPLLLFLFCYMLCQN